ncbi:MAG TPA: SDR family NAD(P)-dependent oxidoreductase, partial [Solirubrobacteraceae bacterium]|nr:SDR family NAD(P)-dependent oxidoreductase [Solirubrobacteraceae bacterium]
FGGINTHVVLASDGPVPPRPLDDRERLLLRSAQDAELFVFAGPSAEEVGRAVARLRERAAGLSRAQLADAAALLAAEVAGRDGAPVRAAVVASTPAEFAARLGALADLLADGATVAVGSPPGVFLGTGTERPRVGLLLPGQAAPSHATGGAMRRRFPVVEDLYAAAPPPADDTVETAFAQPAIVRASLAALRVLAELGIEAEAAVGHSLGELTALAWAGAVDEEAVLRIATARGRAMSELGEPGGAMASVALDPDAAAALAEGLPLAVAGLNAPAQTAVSGPAAAIEALVARARARGIAAARLRVSHAFHSPAMAPAAGALAAALDAETIGRPVRTVVSTVSGAPVGDDDVRELLLRQLTQPVRFAGAATAAFADLDLIVEAGPGRILTGLVAGALPVPAVATDAGGPSLAGLLAAAGAAWALGAPVRLDALFAARFTRPIDLDQPPRLFENPCERAPRPDAAPEDAPAHDPAEEEAVLAPHPPEHAPAVHGPIESADPDCLAAALEAAYAAPAAMPDEPAAPRASEGVAVEGAAGRGAAGAAEPIAAGRRATEDGAAEPIAAARGAAERGATEGRAAEQIAAERGTAERGADGEAAEPIAAERGAAEPDGVPADRLALVRGLVAARAELPLDAILPGSRLLDDLHLNSIVVSEIAVEASRRLGLPPPPAPSALANATVEALAGALADGGAAALAATGADRDPPGAGSWTRAFAVELVERPLRSSPAPANATGRWHVVAPPGDPLGRALGRALARDRRGGVALCLPPEPATSDLPLVLDAARAVLGGERPRRLVVAQSGGGGGGFARALHLEAPDVATCVVDVPAARRDPELIAAEAAAHVSGFVEARYDADGSRREPVLRHLQLPAAAATPSLGPRDVLLVAGGAKGIAAECALALVRGTRAAVACLGRTDPSADPALAAALDRLGAGGNRVTYVRADVTDASAVAAAVSEVEAALGPVTAVLHAAGRNEPALVGDLDERELQATVAPKVDGLRNVLAAVDGPALRLLVTFGSIIARSGMRGDAHYALANEWQTLLTERFAAEHPGCACLAFESSVWASVGMGERLGSIEALAREGIDAIAPDDGAALLARLVATVERPIAVVAAGRLGRMPTLARETADLPLRRFLERPRVTYPGIELVADAELSTDLDPYLRDHVLDGEPLLPAVVGLEAMAQAVMALAGSDAPPVFDEVRFDRPVVVPEGERTTVRVAALATSAAGGRVVLRSARTGFQVDHFSARWRLGEPRGEAPCDVPAGGDARLDPNALYGTLLFHAGRFRRLRGYRALSATRCHAEIDARDPAGWFGAFLPQPLVLGDPGAHDAAIHALQACVPHARVIPVAVGSAWFDPGAAAGVRHVHAVERARGDGAFTFDVAVRDGDGRLVERWDGLELRAVSAVTPAGPWPGPLLATYLERRLEPLDRSLRVAVAEDAAAGRRERSDAAIRMAVGAPAAIVRRPDGRPETSGAPAVSTAHANGLTLAVAGAGPVACDIEPAIARPREVWQDLLGASRLALSDTIAADREEELATAATRVWAAGECLQKAGAPLGAPLTIGATAGDGWLTLSSGDRAVATYVTRVDGIEEPVAVAVLAGGADARV